MTSGMDQNSVSASQIRDQSMLSGSRMDDDVGSVSDATSVIRVGQLAEPNT